MDIVLTHTTALALMRRPYFYGKLGTVGRCSSELPAHMPTAAELDQAREECSLLATLSGPVHVLVSGSNARHASASMAAHACKVALPPGAFVQLAPGIRCSSPALLAVQMARSMSELRLALFLAELLGLYAIDDDAEEGLVQRTRPLTTKARICELLDALGSGPCVRKVRRALARTCERAASPMEAKLFVRVTSRPCDGGYGLAGVTLNDALELERIGSEIGVLRVRKPDLLLLSPERDGERPALRGVVLDYQGRLHADPDQVRADDERRNELLAAGFKDYAIWKENYDSLAYMDDLMNNVRRDLGLPARRCSRKLAEKERAARQRLWEELEAIDCVHW